MISCFVDFRPVNFILSVDGRSRLLFFKRCMRRIVSQQPISGCCELTAICSSAKKMAWINVFVSDSYSLV